MQIENLFQNYITSQRVAVRLKQTTVSTYYRNFEGYIKPFFKEYRKLTRIVLPNLPSIYCFVCPEKQAMIF